MNNTMKIQTPVRYSDTRQRLGGVSDHIAAVMLQKVTSICDARTHTAMCLLDTQDTLFPFRQDSSHPRSEQDHDVLISLPVFARRRNVQTLSMGSILEVRTQSQGFFETGGHTRYKNSCQRTRTGREGEIGAGLRPEM